MNPLRTIPRAAFGAYVKAVRLPFDQAAKLMGRRETEIALDQAEAGARDAAGAVLGDDDLRRDAAQRRAAADEREEALTLKAEAERKRNQANRQAAQRKRQAAEAERKRKQLADRRPPSARRRSAPRSARTGSKRSTSRPTPWKPRRTRWPRATRPSGSRTQRAA